MQLWVSAQLAARIPEPGTPARERRRVLAPDGKTVRGARRADGSQAHLVSVLDQASGAVLAQVQVETAHGAVHMPTAQREIIDPEHGNGADVRVEEGAHQPQQAVAASGQPEGRGQPGTGPPCPSQLGGSRM